MSPPPIRGILTPHMVPLDARGRIHEDELCRYVEWLIERGVHGLYPNGSTGEFLRFTPEERRRIVELVCRQAAGRVPIVAGAAEANIVETLRACEAYAEFGCRAVAVVAPYYYKLGQPAIAAYFDAIAAKSPIDVTLYNIPSLASGLELATVVRLAETPRIIGIKDSSGDVAFMMRLIAAVGRSRDDFCFLTGWEPALVAMLAVGCHGGTVATSGVVPEATRVLYELAAAGQWDSAHRLQSEVTALFDMLMGASDFPEGFRLGAAARGFEMGAGRQPLGEPLRFEQPAVERVIDGVMQLCKTLRTATKRGPTEARRDLP